MRNITKYLIVALKGMAMGAADVVPGVSGGTIAFISGIYEELLQSISAINFNLLKILKKEGFAKAWSYINGKFLLALGLGILLSILSLAKILSGLLEVYPILVWSFFFGLVLASILFVGRQITHWKTQTVLALILGAVAAYFITRMNPVTGAAHPLFYLLFSGALAACAMILPGISGAFILVLLGVYQTVLTAVHQWDMLKISFLAVGAIVGLLSFSRLLRYILIRYRNTTLAALTGFIIGALNKLWPWKKIIKTQEIEGKVLIMKEKNISPLLYDGDNQLVYAIGLALLGFILILILEKWGQTHARQNQNTLA